MKNLLQNGISAIGAALGVSASDMGLLLGGFDTMGTRGTGPGRKTLMKYHRRIGRNKYTPKPSEVGLGAIEAFENFKPTNSPGAKFWRGELRRQMRAEGLMKFQQLKLISNQG